MRPASITTNVCSVIGTGVPGIGISPAAADSHISTANSTGFQDAATIRRASDVVAAADAVVCEVCISMTPMLRDIAVNGGRYAMDEGRFRRVVRYPRQSEPSIWWTVPNESDPVRANRAAMDRCRSGHLPFARR